jgi:hypothetical protein
VKDNDEMTGGVYILSFSSFLSFFFSFFFSSLSTKKELIEVKRALLLLRLSLI